MWTVYKIYRFFDLRVKFGLDMRKKLGANLARKLRTQMSIYFVMNLG